MVAWSIQKHNGVKQAVRKQRKFGKKAIGETNGFG